jgi:hypothetical protein
MSNVLWEAEGKYVPIVFHSTFFNNYAELFIVEKIMLVDKGDNDYKRLKMVGRKVSFTGSGAVVARAGSIVVGIVPVDTPVGFGGKIMIRGYVAENESLRYQTSYGDVVIKNIKTADCPCSNHPSKDFTDYITDCIINYYTELLNMGVDIGFIDKENISWEELERAICVLMLASIKEKLKASMENMDNPYIRKLYDSLATSCGDT